MPTRSTRPARSATRSASSRRGTRTRRTSTPRRGVAGGWLQRRQPEPKGVKKVLSGARRALPRSKGSMAAVGLALVGAAGAAMRKRGGDDHAHDRTPTTPDVHPPVAGPPTDTATTPPNTRAVDPNPPSAA